MSREVSQENKVKALEFGEKLLKSYEEEQRRAFVGEPEEYWAECVYCLKDLLRLAVEGAK